VADTSDVDAAIIARLSSDPTLRALMPDGVFWEVATLNGPTRFVVVSQLDHEDVYVLHGVLWERFTYLVKAVAEGASALAVKAAADRIRQLLHEQALPIAGYQCQVCRRTQRVRYTEESQDTDQLWQHRGGEYEVLATPLTTSMAP